MRSWFSLVVGGLVGTCAILLPRFAHSSNDRPSVAGHSDLAHTERTFEFTANAPIDIVGPLMGANKERVWASGWEPGFVWPADASDREGMVFTTGQGKPTAIWVNTAFDLRAGSVQYVYVVPDMQVTAILLTMTPSGYKTHVTVTYRRTALQPGANDTVRKMADHDGRSGPEWEQQINNYLQTLPPR